LSRGVLSSQLSGLSSKENESEAKLLAVVLLRAESLELKLCKILHTPVLAFPEILLG